MQEEIPQKLQATINNISLEISFRDGALTIEMLSLSTFDEFTILMDDKALKNHTECSQMFQSPSELYDMIVYLKAENKLQATEDGEITFEMKLSFGPLIKAYKILLKGQKRDISLAQVLQKRLTKIQGEAKKYRQRNQNLIQKMKEMAKMQEQAAKDHAAVIQKLKLEHDIEIQKILADRQAQYNNLKKTHAEQCQFLNQSLRKAKEEIEMMAEKHKIEMQNEKAKHMFLNSNKREQRGSMFSLPLPPPPPLPFNVPNPNQIKFPLPPPPPIYKKRNLFDDDEDDF